MSARPTLKARVFDLRPSQLTKLVEREALEDSRHNSAVLDDFADCVESIHACANLAGFSKRGRDLIFHLASFTRARSADHLELFDEELASLQNCSTQTVRRQRRAYLREARALRFDLIEIVEGEFDRDAGRHAPTRYRFVVGDIIARIVLGARSTEGWGDLDRKNQIEIIRRVAAEVYEEIPDAPPRRRKRKRPRKASSEVQTCRKIIEGQLSKLRDRASRLPRAEREQMLDDLRRWWLEERAEMDAFFDADSSQVDEPSSDGQPVQYPSDDEMAECEPSAEDRAAWQRFEERVRAPAVRAIEIALRPPEPVPREPNVMGDEMTVEELEAEAVRGEACGERVGW